NGYKEESTPYGSIVAIENVRGLHQAIGLQLTAKPARFSGTEIRFLRKELELSQQSLGELLGVSAQSVAAWEKSKGRITSPSDRLLRILVSESYKGNVKVRQLIDCLNQRDIEIHAKKMVFSDTNS